MLRAFETLSTNISLYRLLIRYQPKINSFATLLTINMKNGNKKRIYCSISFCFIAFFNNCGDCYSARFAALIDEETST